MNEKNIIIITLIFFFKINIFCGYRSVSNIEDFYKIEDGNLIENLRKVCNVKDEVSDDIIKKEYNKVIDSVIDNGKNIKITEEIENKNRNDRFVSFIYNIMIIFEISDDNKSLKPVLCSTVNRNFNTCTNELCIKDYAILLINNKDSVELYFKKDIVDNINSNFYNKNYFKNEDIANVFNTYKPEYFTIIIESSEYNSQGYNEVKCGFLFKRTTKHKDIFKEDIKLKSDKNCCDCKKCQKNK